MKFSNIQTGSGSQQLSCLLAFQPSSETKAHSLACVKREAKKNLKRVISMVAKKLNPECISMPVGLEKSFFVIGSDTAHKINFARLRSSNGDDSHPLLDSILMAFFALYKRPHYFYSFKIHQKKTLASLNIPDMPLIARRSRKQRLRQCIDFLPM